MPSTMTHQEIGRSDDVAALWDVFTAARNNGDTELADAARARMNQLQRQLQLESFDDGQLLAKIDHLEQAQRDEDVLDLDRARQLDELLDEAERRGLLT